MNNLGKPYLPKFSLRKGTVLSRRTLGQIVDALFNARVSEDRASTSRELTKANDSAIETRHIYSRAHALVPSEKIPLLDELLTSMLEVRLSKAGHKRVHDLRALELRVKELKGEFGLI